MSSPASTRRSQWPQPYSTLPKDFRRVDARRAVRGQGTGERADGREDSRRGYERGQIAWLESVQQRRNKPGRPDARGCADQYAEPQKERYARKDEPDDARRCGADRHADAYLRSTAVDRIRRHALPAEPR